MKKLFLVFLLLSCTSFSFLYYSWQQATQIPGWYTLQSKSTQKNIDFSKSSDLMAAQSRLEAKIEASIAKSEAIAPSPKSLPLALGKPDPIAHKSDEVQGSEAPKAITPESSPSFIPSTHSQTNSLKQTSSNSTEGETSKNQNVEIELSNQEVNELIMTTIAKQTERSQALATVPSLHTTIKDGLLESGTVVNMAELSSNQLPESETAALGQVLKTFPFLENKQIYVGISGNPQIENGQLKWDSNTQIKLGNLSLSLSELSQRLGIPQEKLEQKLNLSLPLGRLKVNDIKVINDKLLLTGSVEK